MNVLYVFLLFFICVLVAALTAPAFRRRSSEREARRSSEREVRRFSEREDSRDFRRRSSRDFRQESFRDSRRRTTRIADQKTISAVLCEGSPPGQLEAVVVAGKTDFDRGVSDENFPTSPRNESVRSSRNDFMKSAVKSKRKARTGMKTKIFGRNADHPDAGNQRKKARSDSESEDILYKELCRVMEVDRLYMKPELQREEIAKLLGTNRTYLSNSVKKHAYGQSITDFVNGYRLRTAAYLLVNRPEMSIGQIEKQAGFNSRETFNRTFRKFYRMTPSRYRQVAIDEASISKDEIY